MVLVSLVVMILALAATRHYVALAFGIRGVRFFFRNGPAITLDGVSPWARPTMVLASAAVAYLLAVVPFAAGALVGGETTYGNAVQVIPGRAADAAGLRTGDHVLAVAGTKIESFEALGDAVRAHPGEPLDVVVERAGSELHVTVTPGAKGAPDEGKIGVAAIAAHREIPVAEAIPFALGMPVVVLATVAHGVSEILAASPGAVAGPVGIATTSPRPTMQFALYVFGLWNTYDGVAIVALGIILLPRKRRAAAGSSAGASTG